MDKPAPPPQEWKDVIERILAGGASTADAEAVQSGVIDGQVLLTNAGQSLAAGRDIARSVIFVGDQKVHIGLDGQRLETLREQLFPKTPGIPPPFPSLLFVGRAAALADLRAHLTQANERRLVIVRGWAGVGKTTVVSALGRDRRLLRRFPDGVLWTSLGQSPSLLSMLSSWGTALGNDSLLRAPTLNAATQQLALLLASKKMLLMVDDVWAAADLSAFLAARGPECMLVATTREPEVAESFTASRAILYPLPVLDEPYALELFQAIAPEVANQHPRETQELVRALEYLPLAIHVAARLLATESKYGWGIADLIEDLKSGAAILKAPAPEDRLESGEIPTVAALLRKSTDLLSEQVRDYFAFFGVFAPKPATFDLAALKNVWELEDPRPIVRELVNRGLLEPVGASRFQMHALLVAHARSLLT